MASLLQARAKPLQIPRWSDKGNKGKGLGKFLVDAWKGNPGASKGKSEGKDKGPSKGKGASKGASGSWVKDVVINGETKQLCMQWQSGKCSRGANCAFIHACAFPKGDGTACMSKSHNAISHANTAH